MLEKILRKAGISLSLNDPEWGRGSKDNKDPSKSQGNNQDIDQIWKDINSALGKLFGKNGGPSNGGGNGTDQGFGRFAGIALAFVGLIWVGSGFFIVEEGQTGVITTFGRLSHQTGAGLNWRWPFPIQAHEVVNVSKVRTIEVGYRSSARNKKEKESLMLTDDENIVDIQFAVQYRLKSASDWIFNIRDQEETIRQVAETSIREIVGRAKMDYVLYEGRDRMGPDVAALMQVILDNYKTGVLVTNVTMQGVQPPEQVQAAFDDAVKASQDKERQKNEGQAYADEVIPKSRGEAARIVQDAEAYKSRMVAVAEGNASRFKQILTEYQKAPAVTRDRLYLETLQQIYSNTSKVVVDGKAGNNMLYLPLDKMVPSAETPKAAAPAPQTQPSLPAPSNLENVPSIEIRAPREIRPRESREREAR